jgi:hypothetical protein
VSRDVIGYEDLDDDGDWISEPEYGYVWAPRHVHAGWAPYRDGRWAWVSPWGWTWVDNSRWGFAPFHYGRWAYIGHRSRWCWVPGPRHVRPIYAPALVGWVGSPGGSVSVGIGTGVGWFPLGPREVYVPGYWHSRRYIHNVNVTNTVIVNNVYINDAYRGRRDRLDYRYRHHGNAVTVISRDSFADGRPIGHRFSPVPDRDLRHWRHDSRPPAIAPRSDSVFAANRMVPSRDINARFARADRQLTSHHSGRVPFDAERRAIESNGSRPVTRSQLFGVSRDSNGQRQGSAFGRAIDATSGTKRGWQTEQRHDGPRIERNDRAQSRGFVSDGQPQAQQWRGEQRSERDRRDSQRQRVESQRMLDDNRVSSDRLERRNEINSPAIAERAQRAEQEQRRNTWRSQHSDSTATFEPRVRAENRPAPRLEAQREARQERIQSTPARESVHTSQPAQRSWRGNENAAQRSGDGQRSGNGSGFSRGGDGGGGREHGRARELQR